MNSNTNNIRYAIIGTGAVGKEHIRNLKMLNGVQITAIADPDDEQLSLATKLLTDDAQIFSNYKDLLSADIADAYVICVPNHIHIDVLPDVIATGKPILMEKPLCTTVDDCHKVINLAEQANVPVWVAMEYRYMLPVAKLIEGVHGGDIGALKMLSIREHRQPFLKKVGDWNRFSRNTGGTLVEKCCHFFDLMRLITQAEPVSVFASGGCDVNHLDERYDGETPDILDNAFVIVNFEGGKRAMLDLCMFAEGNIYQSTITVAGDKAGLESRIPRSYYHEKDGEIRPSYLKRTDRFPNQEFTEDIMLDESLLKAGAHYGSNYYQHEKFLQMVRTGSTPEVTLHDGLLAVAIGQAAEESIKTGQVMPITV